MFNICEYIVIDNLKVHAQKGVFYRMKSVTHTLKRWQCCAFYSCVECGRLPAEVTPCQQASLSGSAHSSSSSSIAHWHPSLSQATGREKKQ